MSTQQLMTDTWLQWDRETAQEKLGSKDVEEVKKAIFRIGELEQDEENWEQSLDFFLKLQKVDKDFYADMVNLNIGQALYELSKVKEAFSAVETAEMTIKDRDRYKIYQLKGRCFEKLKDYPSAIGQYQLSLDDAKKHGVDVEILGNLEYQIGWSMIKQQDDIQGGVGHLITASELISDNVEISLKLANTTITDLSDNPDFMDKCHKALDHILGLEPNNSEAMFLKGKAFYKLGNYE